MSGSLTAGPDAGSAALICEPGPGLARTHFNLSLRAQRGNLVAVAMVVCRRVFNLNEIATWFDRLTMSGCAPRNDRWGVGAPRNDSRPVWFDKVSTREGPRRRPVRPTLRAGFRGVGFECLKSVSLEEFADLLHQGFAVVDTQQQGGVAHPVALEVPFV